MPYLGPVQQHIESTLTNSSLSPLHLEVTNESHRQETDESHFHVLVVSNEFAGKPLLQRHRMVQGLFTDESGGLKFHSLRITARTPEQWNKEVPKAPKCTGKGDGRSATDVTKL